MSDENKTDNPYQPPTLSDEPLAKQKIHPVHWLVPTFGYVYVPALFIFISPDGYVRSTEQYGIPKELHPYFGWLAILSLFVLPIYVVVICFLGWRRSRQGTNTTGMTL